MPRDFSPVGLRVLLEVARVGSFSAAARALGYTQSAVSRQVAGLESVAGRALFERRRDGTVLTPAGTRLLARAARVVDELDAAARRAVEVDELAGQVWVAGRADSGESLPGVWPGLTERPDVRYVVRDWHAKLRLVAAGLAVTTLTPVLFDVLPEGVRVVAVRGEPRETRRLVLARGATAPPGEAAGDAVEAVADALRAAAGRPRP